MHPDQIVHESGSGLVQIHESWTRIPLGDVADVLNGFAFKSAYFSRTAGTPLVRIRDVGRAATETRYDGPFDERFRVRAGDLLVGMDGDFRVARWAGANALLNQRVCKISVRSTAIYDPRFLQFVLPGYLDAIHARTSSVTVKHLSSRTIAEIPVPLPPLVEQQRIVAAIEQQLSRLDAADGALALAVRRTGALMASSLESATTSAGDLIPLGEAATDFRYGTSVKTLLDGDGPPVLRIPNVRGGRIEPTPLKYATVSAEQLGDCFVSDGDLLFVRTNGSRDLIGRAAVTNVGRMAFASYLIRARPREDVLDPRWAAIVLASPKLRAEIASRAATTAGQYNLNLAGIRSLPIPLPPLNVQRHIVSEIEAQISRIEAVRAAIERAQHRSTGLRRAILERAFRGELVPQDPEDEPASELLERLQAR